MYVIKKKINKNGYEKLNTKHNDELLPINEDIERLIFWKKNMVKDSKTNKRRNELHNINMSISILCCKKKNFFKITKKYYQATVKINAENITDLTRFDTNTERLMIATSPVRVSKKGTIKEMELSYPLVGISLFIQINHNTNISYYKKKYNAIATVLIYPIKSNFYGKPTNRISMIGYSDTVPIYNDKI